MSAELFTTLLITGILVALCATMIGLFYTTGVPHETAHEETYPTRRTRAEQKVLEVEARLRRYSSDQAAGTTEAAPLPTMRRQEIQSFRRRLDSARSGLLTDDWLASALVIDALHEETAPVPAAPSNGDFFALHSSSHHHGVVVPVSRTRGDLAHRCNYSGDPAELICHGRAIGSASDHSDSFSPYDGAGESGDPSFDVSGSR